MVAVIVVVVLFVVVVVAFVVVVVVVLFGTVVETPINGCVRKSASFVTDLGLRFVFKEVSDIGRGGRRHVNASTRRRVDWSTRRRVDASTRHLSVTLV